MEPEELDRLEREGYTGQNHPEQNSVALQAKASSLPSGSPVGAALVEDTDAEIRRLAEEETQFQREMRQVKIEEVEDDDL